jgi:hypothetical protein
MSEKKRYGRQIVLSLFLTIIIVLALVYLSTMFLLPRYDISQEQIYLFLVKLFPLLLGLIMLQIGVLIARRNDDDAVRDDVLPPNAYDLPLYTMPGDDPAQMAGETFTQAQPIVEPQRVEMGVAVEEPITEESVAQEVAILPVSEHVEELPASGAILQEAVAVQSVAASVGVHTVEAYEDTFALNTRDFDAVLDVELENSKLVDYDFTLVFIDVTEGPADPVINKLMMLSGDLAYSFSLDGDRFAMILPFYNTEEATVFTDSMVESSLREFADAQLKIGYATRASRQIDAQQLIHEAQADLKNHA